MVNLNIIVNNENPMGAIFIGKDAMLCVQHIEVVLDYDKMPSGVVKLSEGHLEARILCMPNVDLQSIPCLCEVELGGKTYQLVDPSDYDVVPKNSRS